MSNFSAVMAGAARGQDVIIVQPGALAPISGMPVTGPVGNGLARCVGMLYDPAATEICGGTLWLPPHWVTFTADLYWTNPTSASGNVAWRFDVSALVDETGIPDPTAGTLVVTSVGQNVLKRSYLTPAALPAPDGLVAYELVRVATDGSDTLTGDAAVLALVLTRAS